MDSAAGEPTVSALTRQAVRFSATSIVGGRAAMRAVDIRDRLPDKAHGYDNADHGSTGSRFPTATSYNNLYLMTSCDHNVGPAPRLGPVVAPNGRQGAPCPEPVTVLRSSGSSQRSTAAVRAGRWRTPPRVGPLEAFHVRTEVAHGPHRIAIPTVRLSQRPFLDCRSANTGIDLAASSATLISLFVTKPYRRIGIGTRLVTTWAAFMRDRGVATLTARYLALPSVAGCERLLQQLGWGPPSVYSRFYRVPLERMPNPGDRGRLQTAHCRAVPWSAVDPASLDALPLAAEPGFRPYFDPRQQPGSIEPHCSFFVLADDDIAGWSRVDHELADTLLYRALYVRHAYRHLGLGVEMAMQTCATALRLGLPYMVFQVVTTNTPMNHMMRRFIEPLNPRITEFRHITTSLRLSG
jgi:GNAT superfamily N-acetyltransferase